jgi:flagellar hook-associated protein 2
MSQNIVNLLGAGSGIDTLALVNQLVEVEKAAPQERIDSTRELTETKISDLGLFRSAMSTLKDAASAISNSDTFNSKTAAFTDSTALVPVSLDPEAQTGEYSFTVSQLAQSQSLSTEALFTEPTDEVGLGTLTFNFGSWDAATPPADPTAFTQDTSKTSQTITIDASNNSLNGLASAINDANFGVQASVVNDGTGYRLVIRAESGLNNQLQITAADTDGSNTDANGLSRFAFDTTAFNMTQNQVGQDSAFTINGLAVTRSSNTINDVVAGFEYTLSGTTGAGESINISIEDDKVGAETAVRDFVDAYNLFLETIEPLIGINSETNEYGSLYRDTLAKTMPSQIRQLLVADVAGLSSTFTALTNIGIRTELDGTFSIDEDTFTQAIDSNYNNFKNLFIPVTDSSSDQITINSFGENTQSGQYDIVVTTQPLRGSLTGTTIGAGLIAGLAADVPTSATLTGSANTVTLVDLVASSGRYVGGTSSIPLDLLTQGAGATDYDFTITVDGVASAANISLPVADYASYDAMATALQTAINGDANISGVTVTQSGGQFTFTSGTTGAASSISLSAVGASATQLGITTGTATAGTGGANDYDFSLTVDGTTSGTISLTPGSYSTFTDLATHIQTQINADATLSGAGAAVTVTHNGSQFVIASNSTGLTSTLANATAIGTQAATLGFTNGTVTQGATTGGNTTAYDFTMSLDGTSSGTISLDTGTYADMDAVAAEIESQINADSALAAAGAGVDVTYDSVADAFSIVSRRYGNTSTVSITNVGTNAADLGFIGGATAGNFTSGNISIPLDLATQGVAANAYDFTINVDGTSSAANISLPVADYATYGDMATALQTAVNGDANISGVTVSYVNNQFVFSSGTTGATSSVSLSLAGSLSAQLGINAGTSSIGTTNGGTTGVNAAGTVNGIAAFGSGNVLLPALGQPGESLALLIGENATTATVNFSRGFGGELELLIEQFLSNSGAIELRQENLQDDLEDLDTDQSRLDRRIEAYQERLTSQFIAMEAIVRSLQDSSSFLETTLSNLLDSGNDN